MSGQNIHKYIDAEDSESVASAGMDLTQQTRSATFFQQDAKVLLAQALTDAIDVLSIDEALKKFPEAKDHYGALFDQTGREYPRDIQGGYFIRVKKGKTVQLPIQACLFLKALGFKQKVHNLILVEEDARVYLITGCSAAKSAQESFHLGISEFFVKKGGYLNFTMIHSWRKDVSVKPISIAMVEEGASFISNYVCLKPVKEIVMYPTAILQGKGARASFNSLILSYPDTLQDIGSRVVFKAGDTQAEITSRAVSMGGKVIARGHLNAQAENVKAHLECRGLILSPRGEIHAVPELQTSFRDVDMSHEAAIGRISNEEIEYLCSRGFNKEQAQSVIIRGFMDVDILALPELLRREIDELEEKTLKEGL